MARDEAAVRNVPQVAAVPPDAQGPPGRGELLGRLGAAVSAALPASWSSEVRRTPLRRATPLPEDAHLLLAGPDGQRARVAVLVCGSSPEPRDVARLAARARQLDAQASLVVAPFLSPRTRERLVEAGLSHADAAGTLHLTLARPAVFIERAGAARDPFPRPRRLHSLRGPAAARVVRALLDLRPPHGVRALAARAGVPPASVARTLDLLDRDELVERDARGKVVAVAWQPLVRRWADDRGPERAARREGFAVDGSLHAAEALRALDGYAVTGTFAALGSTHGALVAYVDDLDRAAARLDLPRAPAGGLVLLEPDDPVALERAASRFGLVCAAFPQVAADLLAARDPHADRLLAWMAANEHAWRR